MTYFEGKVAIVTGGASGIGRAVGQALAREGAIVVLADVQADLGQETAAGIASDGGKAEAVVLDVTDRDAVRALWVRVREQHGRLDYVFNNAGVNVAGELRDTTLEDWDRLIEVNLKGVVYGTHEAYALMREQGFGHIVNTASLAGLVPPVGEGAYAATKHGAVALSMALRAEARAFGVDVSVVCPGVIETPMVDTGTYLCLDKDDLLRELPIKLYSVDATAEIILNGVRRKRAIIIVTAFARIAWWIYRLAPAASGILARPMLRRIRRIRKAA